eukprot:GGOE01043005.1.p1 GENE.GGOE01043005.1~~GGOE01043005.1.p1  ORF type:complete len:297 (+),score=70.49 GGOE01043005.1:51-893(+)
MGQGHDARALLSAIQATLEDEELLLLSAFLRFDPTLSAGVDASLLLSLIRAVHPSLSAASLQSSTETSILQPRDHQLLECISRTNEDSHIQFIEFLDWWAGQRALPASEVSAIRSQLVAEAMAGRMRWCLVDPAEYEALLAGEDASIAGLQNVLWQCRIWRSALAAHAAEEAEQLVWQRQQQQQQHVPHSADGSSRPGEASRAFRLLAQGGCVDRTGLLAVCRLLQYDPPSSVMELTDRLYFAKQPTMAEADFLRWWSCRAPGARGEKSSPRSLSRFCGL